MGGVSAEEKASLEAEAIAGIQEAIDEDGGGTIQCLKNWNRKYRPILGGYKKFLLARGQYFTVTDTVDNCFTITRAGQPLPKAMPVDRRCWRKMLLRAWKCFLRFS